MSYYALLAKWWMFTNSTKNDICLWLPCDQSCLILASLKSRVSVAGGEQFELVWFIGKICGASGEYLWYFLHLRLFYSTSGIKAGRQKDFSNHNLFPIMCTNFIFKL